MAAAKDADPFVVAAIDFGTTYSGYAFSFWHDYLLDPLKIQTNLAWYCSSGQSLVSTKTPTSVLLNPDKTFNAFGFEAEDKYFELAEEDEHTDYYFFRRFKMLLFKRMTINREVTIEEALGKSMKAIDIFSISIKYLKDHLLSMLETRGMTVYEKDILWVLTVPAIWEEPAKQFMREAATMAGIKSEKLKIVLEPEAASILCNTLPLVRNDKDEKQLLGSFKPGTIYLILDMGGGTVDVTVHEVTKTGTLREVIRASGGAWGGTSVDASYENLLNSIFGKDLMGDFMREERIDYLDMQRNFELKKRELKLDSNKIKILLPAALLEFIQKRAGTEASEFIKSARSDNSIVIRKNHMIVQNHVIMGLFHESLNKITEHIKGILANPRVERIDKILIVGGFSECVPVTAALKKAFHEIKIVIPPEPGLAVLRGAVIFGHNPRVITSRVVHYTYGVAIKQVFDPKIHPEEKKETIKKVDYCKDVFDKFFSSGEEVGNDEKIARTYNILDRYKSMEITLYASSDPNPILVTDECCTRIGSVTILKPTKKWKRKASLKVELGLGGSEFSVTVTETTTKTQQEAKFDFLSN
ncbi:Heat shock 70 kDa protein 12A [Mactra antiquata]